MVTQGQQKTASRPLLAGVQGIFRFPEASIGLVAIIVALIFTAFKARFLSDDAQTLITTTGLYGILAVGEAMLMITGEIDLSAAKIFEITPFMAYYLTLINVPFGLALLVALVGAALIGMVNGIITVRFGVPSLITTLGMLFLLDGITLTVSQSHPVTTPVAEPLNTFLGEGQNNLSIGGLAPYASFVWLALIVVVLTVVLRRTRFGLHTIAVGSNLLAAREIGIHTDRTKVLNFMIMGALAGLGGIIQAVVNGNTDPNAGDNSLTLYAIAAAVIGGTSLFGGSGTIIGALIGAFVISLLNNGLQFIGAQAGANFIPLGLGIIVAMILNIRLNRARGRT